MAYGFGGQTYMTKPTTSTPALPDDWMQQASSVTDPRAWHTLKADITRAGQYGIGGQQALYSNPLAGQFDTETAGPRRGLLGRVKQAARTTPAFSPHGRLAMGKIAAFVGGASALGAASAGGFGGGAGAAGGAGGAGGVGAGSFGAGSSLAGTVGGTTMGAGGFPWAAVAQGGSQLLSGYMNKRASDKASNQQKKNTQAALAQLSPEAIRQLVQMFYTQNYAMLNPQMQAAQRGLASSAGRTGLTGAGVVQQLRAGIPGQFANMALGQANQQGLSVAGQRAGIQAGAPVNTPYSFGNDLQGIMQMLGRYGILRNNQQPTQPQPQNQWWINGPGYDDNEYR